ncbi:uncharacterized protein [Amphiura filiformis]|uniref:uncharacterized protein n=1 Tax=Amphiura filiformis TaxID=82378 RepID=UPI003B225E43
MTVTTANCNESLNSTDMQEKHEQWHIASLHSKVGQMEAAIECIVKMLTEAGFSDQNVSVSRYKTSNEQDNMASFSEATAHSQSNDYEHAPNKPDIKLDKYDGTTSLSNYLLQFELIAEYYNWNDHDKAMHLAANLRGTAQGVLSDVEVSKRHNFPSLIASLNLRFGHENQEELFWMKLNNRVRNPNETLPDLAHDIRTLVKIVFPTMPDSSTQELAKKYFVNAIQDSRVRLNILHAKPASFNAMIQIAVETESFYKAEELRKCHVHVESKTIIDKTITDLINDITEEINQVQITPERAKRKSPSAQRRAWNRRAIR